ncbi:MAG TPA: zf-HC2 domain-containing protein [Spirillospora sp.]
MSCLGERLTALVDGELGHEERDRALAHLAVCAQCRDEVTSLRLIKGRLRGLAGAPPADDTGELPSADFLDRLRSLPARTDLPPSDSGPPGRHAAGDAGDIRRGRPAPRLHGAAGHRSARPRRSSGRPAGSRHTARAHAHAAHPHTAPPDAGHAHAGPAAGPVAAATRPRRRYLVLGAATLFIGLGTASYAAGERPDEPAVTPAFDRFAVEHALTSGDAPLTDPLTDPSQRVPIAPGP